MAGDRDIFCTSCNQVKSVVCGAGDYPDICHECEQEREEKEKREFIEKFMNKDPTEAIKLMAEELWELKNSTRNSRYFDGCIG